MLDTLELNILELVFGQLFWVFLSRLLTVLYCIRAAGGSSLGLDNVELVQGRVPDRSIISAPDLQKEQYIVSWE
jgi:hypothetical protein